MGSNGRTTGGHQDLHEKEIVSKSINRIELYAAQRARRVSDYLEAHLDQEKAFSRDGKAYLLYNVLPDGTPIYIPTKDKNQQVNTKSSAMYAEGILGLNISGQNIIAGVWDGGQVNENHEKLAGQATMQAKQDVDDPDGNDHQTAVTGIMVGKLNNNAQGIAYDAKTMNFDWDNDIAKMNAFAGQGFLVSNHSYGYTNDDSIPVWLFGAYDDEASAWDEMLKSRPYYLPFVAAGNEQEDNGNNATGGYGIITGATASKNVVTVGAVEIDNSISVYSNWGPTDDGRIKPDIVSLGSSIDVPLFDDNSGYTGNVEESSGTSYSAPAVAASALLLQQYYYSLNNEYMTAAMLKALLLHSAEDDASGNGLDAEFGWGMLNVERAAQIIKQNSEGTALMMMINTNPANDGLDEISQNFIFDQGNARASLSWTDDEGIPQIESEGVNPTFSTLVYNFSMKFEQDTPGMESFPVYNL